MSYRASHTVTLSLAVLLASTSLASAGFIWLSPDKPVSESSTYSQQAEPAVPADVQQQGRTWTVDPSVPVAGTPAPVAAPVETAPVPAPMQSSDASVPAPVIQSQPVEMSAASPAPEHVLVPPPGAVATDAMPAPQTEVTLASSSAMDTPKPSGQPGTASSAAMPNAEAMINSMPSMTAPREAAAPASAPVTEQTLASTSPAAPQMLSPATAPMTAATATSPTPAPSNGAVSMVTGQSVGGGVPDAAPAANTDKVVDGFGKHVPLVIAMRQILPEGYGFAHGDGVDLSASIDWQGGKPWPQVLNDAIKPIGLTASVSGDTVMLQKGAVAMAPELAPPAAGSIAPSSVLVPVAPASTAQLAPGQAILTNATVMQAPPSND